MAGYQEIDATELSTMLATQKLRLVDVRNDDEVARGIIAGAMHMPLASIPAEYAVLDGDDALVFYCHSGIRSAQAAAFLAGKDRQKVFNLRGGVLAWGRAGYAFASKN